MKKSSAGFAGIYILIGLVVLVLVGGAYYFGTRKAVVSPVAPRACTQEAKICPDGSSVGRTGLNCEFSPCPTVAPIKTIVSSAASPSAVPVDKVTGWKIYTSQKVGYSIKVPSDWIVKQNEDDSLLSHQDFVMNMSIGKDKNYGPMGSGFIDIIFPISIQGPHKDLGKNFEKGLKGLEIKSTQGSPTYAETDSLYTQIDGKNTLMTVQVYNPIPPPDFQAGSWCNCTDKHYYIDLSNGKILDIQGYWPNNDPGFGKNFDQIISTFKFN